MKKLIFASLGIIFSAVLFNSCMESNSSKQPMATAAMTNEELIKKGEYLVTTIGCNDCHSPKRVTERGLEVIPETMLSGYPADRALPEKSMDGLKKGWAMFNYDLTTFTGPWGQSFAANITPDPTGIGSWTEEQFKRALTQGKFKGIAGSRMLLPPMPWFNFTNMKDEDVKAIFLYLKSIPPVQNVVPAALPPQ
jgi:hypothetical protein